MSRQQYYLRVYLSDMYLLLIIINFSVIYHIIQRTMSNIDYFTSRHEIIQWINNLLKTTLTKIEQLGTGLIYCHLLDAAFPNKVPLNKVKWNAYLQVDFIHNFKILQTTFERLGIQKFIDIQRLVKCRYQDNFEFIQWMKNYISHLGTQNQPYNALQRRHYAEIFLLFTDKKIPVDPRPVQMQKELKRQKEKENRQNKINQSVCRVGSPKASMKFLKPQRSLINLKNGFYNENQFQSTFDKGQSLKAFISKESVTQKSIESIVFKKDKKQKMQVITKSSYRPLLEKKIASSNILTEQQQCF